RSCVPADRPGTYPWSFGLASSVARRFLAALAERVGADEIAPLALAVRHDRAADHLGIERELDLLGPDGEVLAQRVALPVIGHQDAREVRVAEEADPEHVVDLALEPVRA